MEEELAESHRSSEETAGRESGLKKQLTQKEAALGKARQKIQAFESLNKDLDQAVADLQLDLAGTKSREEAHQNRLLALKQDSLEKTVSKVWLWTIVWQKPCFNHLFKPDNCKS